MVTSDAREALFGCNHLGCIAMMPFASCIPFPSSILCHIMLTMLVCATCWLYMHLYTLAYMSMHESCLLVCRPFQHNEAMDIRSKPTFVPHEHHLLFVSCLFVFSLVCLLSCFFACHAYHAYLLYASSYVFLHLFLLLLVC